MVADRSDTGRFLDALFGSTEGVAWISAKKLPSGKWLQGHGRWPAARKGMLATIEQYDATGHEVYMCTTLRRPGTTDRQQGQAVELRWLHVDLDGPTIDPALYEKLAPMRVASGSPGHEHVYIRLTEPIGPPRWKALQGALDQRLGGDHKISDNDVLRVPGTHHRKPGKPASLVVVVEWGGEPWEPAELVGLLGVDLSRTGPSTTASPPVGASRGPLPETGAEPPFEKLGLPYDAGVGRAWHNEVPKSNGHGVDRSEAIFGLVRACQRAGYSLDDAIEVATRYEPARAKWRHRAPIANDVRRIWEKPVTDRPPHADTFADLLPPERRSAAVRSPASEPADPWAFVSARELAAPQPPVKFLVRGASPMASHGVKGGEKKTLKTYDEMAYCLAIASSQDYLGYFEVDTTGPVVLFVAEGGRVPFARRLQRVAATMGISLSELASLPLHVVFAHGPLDGEPFADAVDRALDTLQPVSFSIDPLYPYHPPGVEVANLYERGRMLADLDDLTGLQTGLRVVDHFKKTGSGALDLDSISQAGMAQWADSWQLVQHAAEPDVAAGHFVLNYEFGSRQWGGQRYTVTWDLGAFDLEKGEHDGEMSWKVVPGASEQGRSRPGWAGIGRAACRRRSRPVPP